MHEGFQKKMTAFSSQIPIGFVKKSIFFDELDSTNLKAKELAAHGEHEGTIVIAGRQNKGRGRFDRTWESPEGGLYLSIILRPKVVPEKVTLLPILSAVAVVKVVSSLGLAGKIKWPNDVHCKGKKIAGILLESEIRNKHLDFVIVGIGLNANTQKFSSQLTSTATSIANELHHSVDEMSILKELVIQFDQYYTFFLEERYDVILQDWKNNSDTLGKKIQISTASEIICGDAIDIDSSGFLLVRLENGSIKKITSGDCGYSQSL
jgi:BirA family transcriptional regulator, biotin operon repressor / biotin---[acetyl-CoA-carboxylase] ligase